MANIIVTMKNGTRKEFMHSGRAGGSWTKKLKLEGKFVIIEDEWENQVIIPADNIAEIKYDK